MRVPPPRDSQAALRQYQEDLQTEFPRLRFVDKCDDRFSKLLDFLVRVVTAGSQSRYTTGYVTTIGRTIYLPTSWAGRDPIDQLITLRHEAVHLRQFERYGLVGMSFLYLIPFFPLGLAYGRARIEWEAYEETLVATAELWGNGAAHDPALRERIVRQFVTGAYGWMWPFAGQIHRWIDEALARIDES